MSKPNNDSNDGESALFLAHAMEKFPVAQLVMGVVIAFLAWYYSVPAQHVVFAIGYPLYLVVANKIRFDCNAPARKNGKKIDLGLIKEDNLFPWFSIYMGVFATFGVLLPAAALLLGSSVAGAPHLFLIMSQILMESITKSVACHNVIRLLVPIGFNAYRMPCLVTWVHKSWKSDSSNYWSLGLAVTNLILWAYNLFVFLLLRVLPTYIDTTVSPAAPVTWMGQVVPIVFQRGEKKD